MQNGTNTCRYIDTDVDRYLSIHIGLHMYRAFSAEPQSAACVRIPRARPLKLSDASSERLSKFPFSRPENDKTAVLSSCLCTWA